MATITTRSGKGSALTHNEVDANFTNLNTDKAEVASPTFTGAPLSTTPSASDNTTKIATTAYVQTELGDYATTTNPTLDGTVSGTGVLDEDDMATDSATALATQQSIKAYVDGIVTPTYITRYALFTEADTENTWVTETIPTAQVPATASAIILSFALESNENYVQISMKNTDIAERIIHKAYGPNNSDDAAGGYNTVTIPYASSIDLKWYRNNGNTVSVDCFIDGYLG
jgi:hypothetical protein